MSILDIFKKKQADKPVYPDWITNMFMNVYGVSNVIYNKQDPKNQAFQYTNNAYVYAVVNYLSTLAASIQWDVFEVKDQKNFAKYQQKNRLLESELLKFKSLEKVENTKLSDLIEQPNPLQGQTEYFNEFWGFFFLLGNSIVHILRPDFGSNKGIPTELWNMPSQYVQIETSGFQKKIDSYRFDSNFGKIDRITPSDILHLKMFNPYWQEGQFLFGLSPLASLNRTLQISQKSDDARKFSFDNMGANGLLTNDSEVDMTPEDLSDLNQKMQQKYAGVGNAKKILMTTAKMRWVNFGLSPVDLQVLESRKFDLRDICNAYGVQSQLFNDPDNKTYANLETAAKDTFRKVIIPKVYNLRDEFNRIIVPPFNTNGKQYYVSPNLLNIPELQDDWNTLTQSLTRSYWLTINEKRELMNFDRSDEPIAEKLLIPNNISPFDENMSNNIVI